MMDTPGDNTHTIIAAVICFLLTGFCVSVPAESGNIASGTLKVEQVLDVGRAFSALPVSFDLLTHDGYQYVAYYGPDRRLKVASRRLEQANWTRIQLPEQFPWDSHNNVIMAVDRQNHIHLAANMHVDSLNYYRTGKPLDITTFRQINSMTGRDEDQCTYPRFLRDNRDRLVFYYRDGGSGDGRRIFNVYDAETRQWSRLLDTPLLDGRAHNMNAYPIGPKRGPDGEFHIVWMWRDTPDAATNHDISYMHSTNLVEWKAAGGRHLSLPVTPANKEVVVDPVPSGNGLINMGFAIGFDVRHRPIVSYHKYDSSANSQIYNARWEGNSWKIYQTSDWEVRWEFGGYGSIPSRVGAGPVRVLADNHLVQEFHHWKHGDHTWLLEPETLQPIRLVTVGIQRPQELDRVRSDFPGMQVQWRNDSGLTGEDGVRYMLRWETLEPNRDQPREGPLPAPANLQVYKFRSP